MAPVWPEYPPKKEKRSTFSTLYLYIQATYSAYSGQTIKYSL